MQTLFPIESCSIPSLLTEIPDPPTRLYMRGTLPANPTLKYLAVVGSRSYTPYGAQVCEELILSLRGFPIVIVSGLALGIDGIAHRSALKAGLPTIAIPGSGLHDSVLYPRIHRQLAQDILSANGALISEFEPYFKPRPESFPQRNRIMAGMSHAILVIEAEERSGTLITSRLATEYNRDVFAVPGPIHSETARGPHMLIQKGALLVTSGTDILTAFSLEQEIKSPTTPELLSRDEQTVFSLLKTPKSRDEIIRTLDLPISDANTLLMSLELRGHIVERYGLLEWS